MARTIAECLWASAPCAECEERDCCRDERRVEMLRARVAELERDLKVERERGEGWGGAHAVASARAEAAEQRMAELEKALDAEKKQSAFYDLQAQRIMVQRDTAESRASAAVEAHSALLSRIAGDGTLDAMERASAAEQRVRELEETREHLREDWYAEQRRRDSAEQRAKRMEGALCEAERWIVEHDGEAEDCECSYCSMLTRIRAALAASETEAPAREGDG